MAYVDKNDMKGSCNADAGDAPGQPADTKFIAPGEDITTEVANRAHLQLAENCDILKIETDKLVIDMAVLLNEGFTLGAPSSAIVVDPTGGAGGDINFTGSVLIADGSDSSYSPYRMWRVTDPLHNEMIINDNIVKVIATVPSPVGQGFYSAGVVTFTLNETLPAGSYRLVFARDRQRGALAISDMGVRSQHRHEDIWNEVKTREAALQAQITVLDTLLKVTQRTAGMMRALNVKRVQDILGGVASFNINAVTMKPPTSGGLSRWVVVGDDDTTARYGMDQNNPIPGTSAYSTGAFSPLCDRMQDVQYEDSSALDGFAACGRVSGAGAALFTGTTGVSWTDRSAALQKTTVGNIALRVLYDYHNLWWIICGEDTTGPTGWIRRTQNPTTVWQDPTTFPAGIESMMHMAYAPDGRVLACGRKTGSPDEAVVLKSDDGGDTWVEVLSTALTTEFDFIAYSEYHDRWVVSDSDYCFHTDDDTDTSWTQGAQHYNSNTTFAFDEYGTLIAIGGGGYYDISYDLGVTWESFWWREEGVGTPFFPSGAPNCMRLLGNTWVIGIQDNDDILVSLFSGPFGPAY